MALAAQGQCHLRGTKATYIKQEKPWQNGFAKSGHARLYDKFLDSELVQPTIVVEGRVPSSLGYSKPAECDTVWKLRNRIQQADGKAKKKDEI